MAPEPLLKTLGAVVNPKGSTGKLLNLKKRVVVGGSRNPARSLISPAVQDSL